jgi:hypothetical protein
MLPAGRERTGGDGWPAGRPVMGRGGDVIPVTGATGRQYKIKPA